MKTLHPKASRSVLLLLAVSAIALLPTLAQAAWTFDPVDTRSSHGQYMAAAMDSSGRMHIAYRDGSGDLYHARWDGSSWRKSVVQRNLHGGRVKNLGVGLAVDKSGNAHISYYDNSNIYDAGGYFVDYRCDLKYAKWNGTGWTRKTLVTEHDAGEYNSLALDSLGRPHICFYLQNLNTSDPWFGRLEYMHWNGTAWLREVIDATGTTDGAHPGEYCTMVMGRNDQPRVAYRIITNFDYNYNDHLRYAVRNSNGSWDIEPVTTKLPGGGPSLALAPDGTPHIAIFDGTVRGLRYITKTATGWTGGIVDSGFNAGLYNSLAVNRNGSPCIFYCDENYELQFVRKISGTWHKLPVASGVFMDVKAQFTRDDIPVAACYTPSSALMTAQLKEAEIAVFQPKTTNLISGKTRKSFGTATMGTTGTKRNFIIRNVGALNLRNISARIGGTHPDDYIVGTVKSTSLTPGTSMGVSVTFKPTAPGTRSATLLIQSNDADEKPFSVKLIGQGS